MNDDLQMPEEDAPDHWHDAGTRDSAAPEGNGEDPGQFESDIGDDAEDVDETVPLDRDLPCIRCGYNLRGLMPTGQCPECGARIMKALNFANERLLCMACMRPNHPSAAICGHCGGPTKAAGATAAYWRATPMGVPAEAPDGDGGRAAGAARKRLRQSEGAFAPSLVPVIVVEIVCVPIALVLAFAALSIGGGQHGDVSIAATMALFSVVTIVVGMLPVRRYFKERRAYRRRVEESVRVAAGEWRIGVRVEEEPPAASESAGGALRD